MPHSVTTFKIGSLQAAGYPTNFEMKRPLERAQIVHMCRYDNFANFALTPHFKNQAFPVEYAELPQ